VFVIYLVCEFGIIRLKIRKDNKMIKICPNCNKEYVTVLDRPKDDNRCIQKIFPESKPWQREQLISGICSDKCWDKFLGM